MVQLRVILIIAVALTPCAICVGQEPAINAPAQPKVVKGVPFSAQLTAQTTRILADGNQIVHNTVTLIARDSEGRTRRAQEISNPNSSDNDTQTIVFIHDPVAGISYIMNTRSHSARKISFAKANAGNITDDQIPPRSANGAVSKTKNEVLGIQNIEGVQAEGTRITRQILANEIGNVKPFQATAEIWYSRDIETVVLSKSVDPRFGETSIKLNNIRRAEPDHSLFELPNEYTLVETQSAKP